MSDELAMGRLREELDKLQRICEDLQAENLLKDETIRKLTEELKAAQSLTCAMHRVRDMTLQERVQRRRDALDRIRIEYENRVGHESDDSNGDDEID